jgi:hypothetical protein
MWLKSYNFQGSPSFVLAHKLRALKMDLKEWNEEIFGDVGKRKKELMDGIRELDIIVEGRSLIEEERQRKWEYSRDLERLLLYEEMSWRQKFRMLRLKEGDKNTKFFSPVGNSNRRYNIVDALIVNRSLSSDSMEIREHIVQFYSQLYSKQFNWRPQLDGLSFNLIEEDEGSWLDLGSASIYLEKSMYWIYSMTHDLRVLVLLMSL